MFAFLSPKNSTQIAPSSVLMTVSILVGLYGLYQLRSLLLLVFLAFILMVAINPLARFFENTVRAPKALSIILAYAVFVVALVGLVAVVVPPLVIELLALVKTFNIPVIADQVRALDLSFDDINSILARVEDSFNLIMSAVSATFGGIFAVLMVIVLSFYLKLERPLLHRKLYWFTHDEKHIKQGKTILDEIEVQMGGWVRAQVLLMGVVGLVTYLGLLALGVPFALPLAVIAGLLEIVPNIGPIVSAVPAILIAFLGGGWLLAGLTTLLYIVVQQLENAVLVPRIMSSRINVNPFISIVAILAGAQLAGISGALLSLPSYIIVRVLYSHLFGPAHRRAAAKE